MRLASVNAGAQIRLRKPFYRGTACPEARVPKRYHASRPPIRPPRKKRARLLGQPVAPSITTKRHRSNHHLLLLGSPLNVAHRKGGSKGGRVVELLILTVAGVEVFPAKCCVAQAFLRTVTVPVGRRFQFCLGQSTGRQ
jgi:hypothetical protein